jgi:UDP-2,3-diacylglucosamine hydrolase
MAMDSTDMPTARPLAVALFVSDLHLQPDMPRTLEAFLAFLDHSIGTTRQLYLLGDIFEYWVGDDDLSSPDAPLAAQVADKLRHISDTGIELFWMGGNRDFLVGPAFAKAAHLTLLEDPHILVVDGRRFLLTHGDQLCTDDHAYRQFRAMVRDPAWQAAFLAKPLSERKQIAAGMRQQSRSHQQQLPSMITDVNQDAVTAWLDQYQVQAIIHGHTHRPADHRIGDRSRHVLSDWDLDHEPLRGDWFRLLGDGTIEREACPHRPFASK